MATELRLGALRWQQANKSRGASLVAVGVCYLGLGSRGVTRGPIMTSLVGHLCPPFLALGVVQFCLLSAFAIQPVTWHYCR